MKIKKIIKSITGLGKSAKANPYIALGAVGILGVFGVAVSGYNSGKKAEHMLIEKRAEKKQPLTVKERVVIIAKCAWVTALLAVLTSTAIGLSVYTANKQISKLTMAYTTATALLEAHERAELIKGGTDVAKDIKKFIVENDGLPVPNELNIVNKKRSDDDELWYDMFTGFYFYATQDKIDHLRESIYHYMKDGEAVCELSYLFDFLDYNHKSWPSYCDDFEFEIEDTLGGCEYADKVHIIEGAMIDQAGHARKTIDYYDICRYRGDNKARCM